MSIMLVAAGVLLLWALLLAIFAIRRATQGTELRIVFRNGGRITTIIVSDVTDGLFTRVAQAAGISSEEIAHE